MTVFLLCEMLYLELNIFVINCSFAAFISLMATLSCSYNFIVFCITMIEKRPKYIGHTSYRRPSSSNVGLMFFAGNPPLFVRVVVLLLVVLIVILNVCIYYPKYLKRTYCDF